MQRLFRLVHSTLVEKEKSKSPSPSPSEGDSDEEQEDKIDFDDGPGATLIEHTFRNGLELAEARADTDFAQFGPWVGRRATLSANEEGEEDTEKRPLGRRRSNSRRSFPRSAFDTEPVVL